MYLWYFITNSTWNDWFWFKHRVLESKFKDLDFFLLFMVFYILEKYYVNSLWRKIKGTVPKIQDHIYRKIQIYKITSLFTGTEARKAL